jgi:hypothetical protein
MSSYDAYDEPERARTFTVVLLALLILTVIGALFGFVLGRRDGGNTPSGAGDGQSAGPSTAVTTKGVPKPVAEECPQFIGTAAKSRDGTVALPLSLQLFVRTDKREAWVCLEADGQGLWYQGHDKKQSFYDGGAGETPKEGDNGLLLGPSYVTGSGVDKYIAKNGGTTYNLSRDKFVVVGGQNFSEEVRESRPRK